MDLSNRINRVEPSATLSISEKATQLKKDGTDIVDFGAGEPDFPTPDPIKQAAKQAIDENFTHYTAASGIPELKEAIVEKFRTDQGLEYDRSQVSVGCGAKHVLFNIMTSYLDPGDEVVLFAPYWVSYPNQIRFSDAEPVVVDTTDTNFIPDFERVKDAVSDDTTMLIMNSPSNPTGQIFPENVLRTIAEFCAREDILLISDEIYEKMRYTDDEHVCPATFSEDIYDNTVVVNGVSKAYAMTGWRIGYAAGPEDLLGGMNKLMGHSTSNPTSISQKAALRALRMDDAEIQPMVEEFAERRDLVHSRLQEIDGIEVERPKGAFYVFPNVEAALSNSPSIDDDHELVMTLLEEAHIAPVPGSAFGAPNHLRLSYANAPDRLNEGLDRLADWIEG